MSYLLFLLLNRWRKLQLCGQRLALALELLLKELLDLDLQGVCQKLLRS